MKRAPIVTLSAACAVSALAAAALVYEKAVLEGAGLAVRLGD